MSTAAPGRRPALDPHPVEPGVHRVVLATNGDRAAETAVRWVAERARLHVLDVDVVQIDDGAPQPAAAGGATAGAARRAADRLALHAPSVRTRVRTLTGDRRRVLVDLSAEADLLVLGTRRQSAGPPHLVAGFATLVAEHAHCPTAVVPRDWQASAGPVVVAVEGDGSDDAAVEFAAREALALHRDLVLVHAWPLLTGVPALEVDVHGDPVEHRAGAKLDRAAARARDRHPDVHVVRVLERGEPVEALLRAGRGAAMLVVGTHVLTLIDRLLLRSVSRGVLERPSCPVVVVPPGPDAAPR